MQVVTVLMGRSHKKVAVSVYSKEEADKEGISYVHWKEVRDEWKYVITDDEMVVPAIKIWGPYETSDKRTFYQIRMPHGIYMSLVPESLYHDPKPKRTYKGGELTRKNAKAVIKAYAKLLIEQGGEISNEQFEQLARMFRSDQKDPVATFKRALKDKAVKEMLAEELTDLLKGEGITPIEIIRTYKELKRDAQEIANAEQDISAMRLVLAVNNKFADMLDMKPAQRIIQTQIDEIDFADIELPSTTQYELNEPDMYEIDDTGS